MNKHKVENAQRSFTLSYVVLEFVCHFSIFDFTKVAKFFIFSFFNVYLFSQ